MAIKVACQLSKAYVSSLMRMMDWTNVPSKNKPVAFPACHARALIHLQTYLVSLLLFTCG